MKKAIMFLAGVLCLGFYARSASADKFDFRLPGGFEIQTGVGVGGSIQEPTPKTTALNLDIRLRSSHSSFGFEQTLTLPEGRLNAVLLNILHSDHARLHLDVGYFKYFDRHHYLSVPEIRRSWDAVAGAGIEVLGYKHIVFTVDGKIFFPAPITLLRDMGSFFYGLVAQEAQKGAQIWFGINYLW